MTRAIDDLRDMEHGIFPAMLVEAGLGPALESIADRAGIPVEIESLPVGRCHDRIEMAGYFVAREAIDAAARHRCRHAIRWVIKMCASTASSPCDPVRVDDPESG